MDRRSVLKLAAAAALLPALPIVNEAKSLVIARPTYVDCPPDRFKTTLVYDGESLYAANKSGGWNIV